MENQREYSSRWVLPTAAALLTSYVVGAHSIYSLATGSDMPMIELGIGLASTVIGLKGLSKVGQAKTLENTVETN